MWCITLYYILHLVSHTQGCTRALSPSHTLTLAASPALSPERRGSSGGSAALPRPSPGTRVRRGGVCARAVPGALIARPGGRGTPQSPRAHRETAMEPLLERSWERLRQNTSFDSQTPPSPTRKRIKWGIRESCIFQQTGEVWRQCVICAFSFFKGSCSAFSFSFLCWAKIVLTARIWVEKILLSSLKKKKKMCRNPVTPERTWNWECTGEGNSISLTEMWM